VIIDVKVALCLHCHVDERMARELLQHMVEETDTRRNVGLSGPVQVDGDGNRGFLRLALDSGAARLFAGGHWLRSLSGCASLLTAGPANIQHRVRQRIMPVCIRRSGTYINGLTIGAVLDEAATETLMSNDLTMHATTIVTVRKGGRVVIAGDGQVSMGQTIMKGNARKVRRLGKGNVIAGFAGATADAFTLLE